MATVDDLIEAVRATAAAAGLMPGSANVGRDQINATYRLALEAKRIADRIKPPPPVP